MRAGGAPYIETRRALATNVTMPQPRLYLDHAATTPLLPAAREAMAAGLARWANPSSPHAEGRAARAALEDARERIKRALGWDGELIFTSGATEAAAIAFARVDVGRRYASAVEHDAVLRAAGDAPIISVDRHGAVDLDGFGGPALVAIQTANNETGALQDFGSVAAATNMRRAAWLADCSQSAGKLPLPRADLIIVSAHKLGGPPGMGALLVRELGVLKPSGGQEQGYRGGTENLPAALGFAAALEAAEPWMERAAALRAWLEAGIVAVGGEVVAADAPRIPTIGAYRMPGVAAAAQLIRFDLAGIAVSAGSACSSGSLRPSHVLAAMGWAEPAAREVIRVSFGPDTCEADVDRFLGEWTATARRRAAA